MKFYNIAYKNLKGNLHRYIMYYLSNVFSVMLFFLFANFTCHPAISNLESAKNAVLYTVSRGIVACQYVIIIFTFFFVSYSNTTFIKSRSREFGLLSLFGMTKGQIRKYVAYENILISLLSILGGVFLGGLFSKLFFMAAEATIGMGVDIKFMIVPKAILVTAVSFLVLFQVINIFSLRKINSKTIVTQLKSVKMPKPLPAFSLGYAVLGILLIAAGYILAWFSNIKIVITMLPVLFLTITGTYFLFTQFSVAITRALQRNKGVFYKKTNMVVLSQIIYKLRDNAKVFFLISILGAVTLTAAGTMFALYNEAAASYKDRAPQHIAFIEKGQESHNVITPEKAQDIFNRNNVKVQARYRITGIKGTYSSADGKSGDVLAISCSDYNERAKALKMNTLNLKGNSIELVRLNRWSKDPVQFSYNIGGPVPKDQIAGSVPGRVMSTDYTNFIYVAVFSDTKFAEMVKTVPADDIYVYYGYDVEGWKSAAVLNSVNEMYGNIPKEYKGSLFEEVTGYATTIKTVEMLMIIGMFIALLFLIATGSMIYFKLFSELNDDRAEFISLMKMGMTKGELNRIINTQMIIIFFLPFVVASSHASFALKTLSDLLQKNLVSVGLTVVSIYLLFQVIYYFVIRVVYKSQIRTI
jgi:ABC-type transport system, involved in lipoprotein release, permease component